MTERGPWGARDGTVEPQAPAVPVTPAVESREASLDKGQHPAIAILGTLAFFGFIWFLSGSWVIATALIFGLLVHEYGHVLAMNRLGTGPARIYIIPFLGGVAKSQRLPSSEWDGVLISLAGPLFGLLATIPFFGLYFATHQQEWILAVFVICMLNLVNLAPAPPLDGSQALGPVLSRIHPWVEKGAMLLIGGVVIVWALQRGSYIFGGFLAIALFAHMSRGMRPHYGRPLTNGESARSVGLYLVTAAACAGVAIGAVTLLSGDPVGGFRQVLSYFGFLR